MSFSGFTTLGISIISACKISVCCRSTGESRPAARTVECEMGCFAFALRHSVWAPCPLLLSDQWLSLLFTGVFSFSHWLTDIGLSSRVSRHPWLFISIVLAMGSVGFLWMVPRVDHMATRVIPTVLTARWGLGFVHFLYSRWVWSISDPKIRATIGRGIFTADTVHCGV